MTRPAKLLRLIGAPRYWRGLRLGVAAGVEHEPVLAALDLRTVVDVGASRGQFSLVARRLHPSARIISFEPLAAAAARYRQLFRHCSYVSIEEVALGAEARVAELRVSRRDDSSSLLPITALQESVFPGTKEGGRETVRVDCLENVLRPEEIARPAFLKIDVQGGELAVLQGAGATLDAFDHVYVECSFFELYAGQALAHEVIGFLADRKLVLRGIHNPTYDPAGRCVQADFLCQRV